VASYSYHVSQKSVSVSTTSTPFHVCLLLKSVTFKQHVPPLFFGDKVEPETKSAELTKVAVPHLLVSIRQRFSNCGARPPEGAPLVLWAEGGGWS
jgi:hypothetical protein